MRSIELTRRGLLKRSAAAAALAALPYAAKAQAYPARAPPDLLRAKALAQRPLPASGER